MSRIILAEDDIAVREMMQRYLETRGHKVTTAADGVEAAHLAETLQPDLIITDLQMPSATGRQAYDFLQLIPRTVGTPVIFVSGLPLAEVKKLLPDAPNVRFLSKPFAFHSLDELIHELLPGRR